jgi:hypothetical protein
VGIKGCVRPSSENFFWYLAMGVAHGFAMKAFQADGLA